MKLYRKILLSSIIAFTSFFVKAQELKVIPFPNEVEVVGGLCDLSQGIKTTKKGIISRQLYDYFKNDFSIKKDRKGVPVQFIQANKGINSEGYRLVVKQDSILITAATAKGYFYAIQTLRQLVYDSKIPCVEITDIPAFSWRAYMLDESRHFHGKETVKQILDNMALLKMNTFHWHLTDDAGWRIEIKKYPLLTEIGSRRDSTQIEDKDLVIQGETGDPAYDAFLRRYKSEKFDTNPHVGFYTQDDIREIVEYANERCIQIIPEISMPGHASAAIASYPWLGTTKEPIRLPCRFGVMTQVYDPSYPKVITFLQDVLTEVSALFPSPYIHIGGDEVKFDQWKASESVKRYMELNNLENYRDVQVKLTNDMCDFIEDELGKKMVGWNEILGINPHQWGKANANSMMKLSENAIVQFWTGDKEILIHAIDSGYKIINSFAKDTYLDYSYEQLSLKRSYHFNPVPEGYSNDVILGLGCQMWTEWVRDREMLEYQTFPRIAAFAEIGWSNQENKSYERFKSCLQPLIQRWESDGLNLPDMDTQFFK